MRFFAIPTKRYLLAVAAVVSLVWLGTPLLSPAEQAPARRPEPRSEQACGEASGVWSRAGLQGVAHCVRPALDAGRVCQGRGDCETLCVTDDDTPQGTVVAGRCFEWSQTVGYCYNRVRDGVAVGLVCKD